MLGLGDQVGGDAAGSAVGVGEDHPLGRAGGQVDADLAADLELGGGHPGVAGADDPVDRVEAGVRQPVREGADRLGAAGDDERLDPEQAGGAEQDRVDGAVAVGRADATTIRPTPATRAGTTVMTSDDGYGAEPPGT